LPILKLVFQDKLGDAPTSSSSTRSRTSSMDRAGNWPTSNEQPQPNPELQEDMEHNEHDIPHGVQRSDREQDDPRTSTERTSNRLGDRYMYLVHELVHAPVAMLEPFSMHGIPFRTQSSDLFKCQRPVDKIDSISTYAT
jgi:hypothetical protein